MITELGIDRLSTATVDNPITIYYVAHRVELREGPKDEHIFKSVSGFRVIELKVSGISNAYFEYIKYKNDENKEANYHTETEVAWVKTDDGTFNKVTYYHTVPNTTSNTKDFNSRIPSLIYGIAKRVETAYDEEFYSTASTPITPIYTNYPTINSVNIASTYDEDIHGWKYMKGNYGSENTNQYSFMTSNWYLLDIINFPRVEKPLISIGEKCAYFMTKEDAISYVEQLMA